MTHSTVLPGSKTLSQNEVIGLSDEACKAQIKDLGSTQMCGSKISSSSNVMLVNYGFGGGVLNLVYFLLLAQSALLFLHTCALSDKWHG